jgi:hypothetical protein
MREVDEHREEIDMTRRTTRNGWHVVFAAAILAVVALVGSACRPVEPPGVAPWDPTGYLESVRGGRGTVTVTGWATQWDLHVGPNGAMRDQGPVLIAVLVDGEWAQGLFPADEPRPDVDRVVIRTAWNLRQPNMGYGFDITVPADPGKTGVCVSALNQNLDVLDKIFEGVGDHVLLGCRTVTVS